MNLLLTVFIVFFLIVVLSTGFWLGVWWWHERAKNNYKLAYIFVDDGSQTKVFKGEFFAENSKSVMYTYSKKSIVIPHNYGFSYFKHRRQIDIDVNGDLQYRGKKVLHQSEYDSIIKALTLNHIGADIVNAISSRGLKIGMVIIVAIVALAIGALAMNLFNVSRQSANKNTPVTQQPIAPQPSPPSGEVK